MRGILKKASLYGLVWAGFMLFGARGGRAADSFPLRAKYPTVPTIELGEAFKQYDSAIFVDVRSQFEFDVIHVKKAIHIPFANPALFVKELLKARPSPTEGATLILYCNGVKCPKSYDAAETILAAGWKSFYVMDAGILVWGRTHPENTVLVGQSPADPKKIISEARYQEKMVSLDQLKKAAISADVVIFDIRDAFQIQKKLELPGIKYLPLDQLKPLIVSGKFKDKKLYFVDAVGKQVEWLQYYLDDQGYQDYWFLKGGIDGT